MIFFDQAECAKIPIWENKPRIKTLTLFRHLYIDRILHNPREHRSEINKLKPAVQKMVTLAGITTDRSWPTLYYGHPSSPADIEF
jgi:hypothetical protein